MDISQEVRQFILDNFYVTDRASLGDDTSLLDLGIIDSTGVLEVIMFLEKQYGIAIIDSEMIPENLETISRIAAFVTQKRSANRSAG
jgi:acyl carrier protein